MAFYTSRVDKDGNEIERRFAARSSVRVPSGASNDSLSDNMAQLSLNQRNSRGARVLRRYVNSAAYIEKEIASSPSDSDLDYDIRGEVKLYSTSKGYSPISTVHDISYIDSEIKELPKFSSSLLITKSSTGETLKAITTPETISNPKIDTIPYYDLLGKDHSSMLELANIDTKIKQLPPTYSPPSSLTPKRSTGAIPKIPKQNLHDNSDEQVACRKEPKTLSYDEQLARQYSGFCPPKNEYGDSEERRHKLRQEEAKEEWLNHDKKTSKKSTQGLDLKASKLRATPKVFSQSSALKSKPAKSSGMLAKRYAVEREEKRRASILEKHHRMLAEKAWEEYKVYAASKSEPEPPGQDIPTVRGTISDIFINPSKWPNDVRSDDH